MKINPNDVKKIKHVLTRLLRVSLPNQHAIVVMYERSCPDHHVYNTYVSPPHNCAFKFDVANAFQLLAKWAHKHDDSDVTYIHGVMVDGACTHISFCFMGVKCAFHIFHLSDYMQAHEGARLYIYSDGTLTQPAQDSVGHALPPGASLVSLDAVTKDVEVLTPGQGVSQEITTEILARLNPAHVATVLFMLVTLLGGTTTVRQMGNLKRSDKGAAFRYLRTFYRNKFFNGKEKTGKRPSFLQRFFTTKKA